MKWLMTLPLFGLAGCFVGDEGPAKATQAQVDKALKACAIASATTERNSDSGQIEVTLYDDEPAAPQKVACLEAEQNKEAVSFAIWTGVPRRAGMN